MSHIVCFIHTKTEVTVHFCFQFVDVPCRWKSSKVFFFFHNFRLTLSPASEWSRWSVALSFPWLLRSLGPCTRGTCRTGDLSVCCCQRRNDSLMYTHRVILRGKGDYHRLGHGSDDHVRRPRQVQGLQGKKVIAIATGSLHCVCCTEDGR